VDELRQRVEEECGGLDQRVINTAGDFKAALVYITHIAEMQLINICRKNDVVIRCINFIVWILKFPKVV